MTLNIKDPEIIRLREKFRRKTGTNFQQAILGDGNGNIQYTGKPGYVYVRINQGNSYSAATFARMDAVMPEINNAACIVATVDDELTVVRGDVATAAQQGASITTSYNPYNRQARNTAIAGTIERDLQIQPTDPESQSILITAGAYVVNGVYVSVAEQTVDLSGSYPGSGLRNLTTIFLDGSGNIETQSSTDVTLVDPPNSEEVQECIDAASLGAQPLYSVNLVDGDTEIKDLNTDYGISCLWQDLRATRGSTYQLPAQASGFTDEFLVVSGNAITLSIDTAQTYNMIWFQTSPADGNSAETKFFISPGTYTLYAYGATASNNGLIDWSIDGTTVITGQDWYSASTTKNVVKSGSVTVSGVGRHTLRLTINGKNASSTNYFWTLNKWLII